MAIEVIDKGVCLAMGQASTNHAAPGVRAQGVAMADYQAPIPDGCVDLTLDANFGGLDLVVLVSALDPILSPAVFASYLLQLPNIVRLCTYDTATPPVLAPAAVTFAIFRLDLPAVTQLGP